MTRASEATKRRLAALARHREVGQFRALDPDEAGPSARLQVRVPASLQERLDTALTVAGVTRSEALRQALDEWLERRERP